MEKLYKYRFLVLYYRRTNDGYKFTFYYKKYSDEYIHTDVIKLILFSNTEII